MKRAAKRQPIICFLDADTVDRGDISLNCLRKQGLFRAFTRQNLGKVLDKARDAEILISNKFYLGERELGNFPKLKLICVAATGTNNVDLEAARKRGIAVSNVAGYSTRTVVEHTLGFLLVLSHRLLDHHRAVQSREWCRSPHFALLDYPYQELQGKYLGIIGYGSIGRSVAKLAMTLGMRVGIAALPGRAYAAREGRVPLATLLKNSDFVSIHCALSSSTRHLFNAARLRKMKPTAALLNLARGPIVDEAAVARALALGKLGFYAADVLTEEPPRAAHPLLAAKLRKKVLLTPHIAWASREARQRLIDEIAKNIEAFKKSKRRNRVV